MRKYLPTCWSCWISPYHTPFLFFFISFQRKVVLILVMKGNEYIYTYIALTLGFYFFQIQIHIQKVWVSSITLFSSYSSCGMSMNCNFPWSPFFLSLFPNDRIINILFALLFESFQLPGEMHLYSSLHPQTLKEFWILLILHTGIASGLTSVLGSIFLSGFASFLFFSCCEVFQMLVFDLYHLLQYV